MFSIWKSASCRLLLGLALVAALPSLATAQDPHFINTYRLGGGQVGQPADAWLLGRERAPDPGTWGWPAVDPGRIDVEGLPAVLDAPQVPPAPPGPPGGGYQPLPEPGSLVLLAVGGALMLRRRRQGR